MNELPPDVILLILEEVANLRDFGTLFNCAISGRHLTGSSLMWMYSIHHTQASIRDSESIEAEISKVGSRVTSTAATFAHRKRLVSKWALQWRSIILSSLGKTAYPYCLYIRSLDLSNLDDLFGDDYFRDIQNKFFSDDMSYFLSTRETPLKARASSKAPRQVQRLATPIILNLVGEAISKCVGESADRFGTTAALEDLSGRYIEADALPIWVSRLSRLKSLNIMDGSILNSTIGSVIQARCRSFDTLYIYTCRKDNDEGEVDRDLASFFNALAPNSLRVLNVFSFNDLGIETLSALNNHGASLVDLNLSNLKAPTLRALSVLTSCTSLRTVTLHDANRSVNLEAAENHIFLDIVSWLRSCKQLRNLRLIDFLDGPAILTAVCLDQDIHLKRLRLSGYTLANNQDFHRSLMGQTSLEYLELRADVEDSSQDDNDVLVYSLCALENLKSLNILDTSDGFHTAEIEHIANSLEKLEEFSVGGEEVFDDVWPAISNLHHLKILTFYTMSSFTFEGILGYVSTLHSTNHALHLSIQCATMESELSDQEVAMIRESLADKVDGRFDFALFRDGEAEISSDTE